MQQHCYDLYNSIKIIENKYFFICINNEIIPYPCKDVIRISAEANYSNVYIKDMEKQFVTKAIKKYEEELPCCAFFRVHYSHLINFHHIKSYCNKERLLIMKDGFKIIIPEKRINAFNKFMDMYRI